MPAKKRVGREDIIDAAFALVRENGPEPLSARSLAAALGCSTQPIFSNFESMEALFAAVLDRAWRFWLDRTAADMASGRYSPYKASGMSYIAFAVEEKHLFALLFMRDRSHEDQRGRITHPPEVIRATMAATGMSERDAERFHTEMWMFVHGLAVTCATGFLPYDEEAASGMLSEIYQGLLMQYRSKGGRTDG